MRFTWKLLHTAVLACLSAGATPFLGTPSPNLNPVFGTLVNFDDKPTLSPVLPGDYAAVGVASITELEGLGTFARYPSSQSLPNAIGTGTLGERGGDGDPFGFDGTIRFRFANPQGMVGIGIAETPGAQLPVLSVFSSNLTLLETFTPAFGLNIYAGFLRNTNDIGYLQVRGDGFMLDDLQFRTVPEPGTASLVGFTIVSMAGLGLRRRGGRGRRAGPLLPKSLTEC